MAALIPVGRKGGLALPLNAGDLMVLGESAYQLTTVGDGVLVGAAFAAGIVSRTGPVGAYADTVDTSDLILAAIAGADYAASVQAGHTFRFLYINTVAQAMTLTAASGVVLETDGGGVNSLVASAWREYLMTIYNPSPKVVVNATMTNGSKVVTFVLPSGQSSLPIGPAPGAFNATSGMIVTGTSIAASTKVDGITQGLGGITGIHLDTNASGSTTNQITLWPSIGMKGLRRGTL